MGKSSIRQIASCVMLDENVKQNLKKLAVLEMTNISTIINAASALYVQKYLEEHRDRK
jgi:hypothetical protein